MGCSQATLTKLCPLLNNYLSLVDILSMLQCWTKGRSSTAVAEDLRPTATATVAEV